MPANARNEFVILLCIAFCFIDSNWAVAQRPQVLETKGTAVTTEDLNSVKSANFGKVLTGAGSKDAFTIYPPELSLEIGAAMGAIVDLAFSPNGNHLAVAADGLVRIVDAADGCLVTTIRGDRSRGSYGAVSTVAYSPDGTYLVVGIADASDRGSIRLYETRNYRELVRLISGLKTTCRHLKFSDDSRQLLAADIDGEITLYDWVSITQGTDRINGRVQIVTNRSKLLDEVQFIDASRSVVTIEADGPHVYSTSTLAEIRDPSAVPAAPLKWLTDIATGMVVFPLNSTKEPRIVDFQFAHHCWVGASKTDEKHPVFWAAGYSLSPDASREPVSVYRKHRYYITSIALSYDGSTVASGDQFGEVHVWRFRDGEMLYRIAAPGRPIYNAAIDSSSSKIGFTWDPDLSNWSINNYGLIDRQLDLRMKSIEAANPAVFSDTDELRSRGDEFLKHSRAVGEQKSKLARYRHDRKLSEYVIRSGKQLTAYTFLPSSEMRLGTNVPVLLADSDGQVACWDATGSQTRRFYRGHNNMVTSISVAPHGRCFVTGSSDKTIRFFSLLDYEPAGIFDFEYENNTVIYVPPGSESSKAGVRVGDRVVTIDGVSLNQFYERLLMGERSFLPNQRVEIQMSRDERPMTILMRLREGFDYVEPILSLFIRDETTWVIWTPEGFYDCSPGGDALVGWHVNHGPYKSAEFYRADQFRETMYRPDVIWRLLSEGVFNKAVAASDRNHPGVKVPPKLNDVEQMRRMRPPSVEWVSPKQSLVVSENPVEVSAKILPGGAPTREVTFLLNGDPIAVQRFDPKRGSNPVALTRTLHLRPGRNTVAIVAATAEARSNPVESQVSLIAPMTQSKRNILALVIGVNRYQDSRIQTLKWARADAEGFDEKLRQQSSLGLYSDVKTQLLLDDQADRAAVIDALSRIGELAKEGDAVVLFFAMHGFLDDRGRYYLAGHDVDRASLRSTAIPWDSVLQTLHEELSGCSRYIFLDSCHSGGAAPDVQNPLNELTDPRYGTTFFSSCDITQESQEQDRFGHGAFTKVLIDAFADPRADIEPIEPDGILNALELTAYVRSRVLSLTDQQQKPVTFFHQQNDDRPIFASRASRH